MAGTTKVALSALAAIGLLVLVAVGGGMLLGGFTKSEKTAAGEAVSQDARQLVDNTSKAKGKTFRFLVRKAGSDRRSLRDRAGEDVEFHGSHDGVSFDVVVTIPKGLDVPNVEGADPLSVTFECREGDLRRGNVATRVARP